MKWMQIMPMVLTGVAAVLCDMDKGKIPNGLILLALAAGFGWQVSMYGAAGLLHFLGGMMLPVLLLGGLFYFRMMGAGDIKLLAAAGGFLGTGKVIPCIVWSFLAGAVYACGLLFLRQNLKERLQYFGTYVLKYFKTRKWEPYYVRYTVDIGDNCLYFSIPVLISILLYAGGVY